QQDDGIDHAPTLTDLHRQRVGRDECEGPGLVQGAVAELLDVLVQRLRHPADLRLRERVDAQGLHQLVHAAGGDTGEVAVRDDRDQRGFGAFAPLEQPLGKVGARAELGDRDVDRADPCVEVAMAVAVALRRTTSAGPPVLRAGNSVRVRGEQGVDHVLQQAAHQIRRRRGQGFTEQAGRVDNVRCGHRDDSVRGFCGRLTRRITRWPRPRPRRSRRPPRYTTIGDSTWSGPYQRSSDAYRGPVTTPPGSSTTGGKSHAGPDRPATPIPWNRGYKEGNGVPLPVPATVRTSPAATRRRDKYTANGNDARSVVIWGGAAGFAGGVDPLQCR